LNLYDKKKYVLYKGKKGWMPKKHPTKDYIHPICKQSTRSATSKAETQKFPLSPKWRAL